MGTPKLSFGYGEAPGGGSLHSGSVARGDTPTPALPRKRERERTFFGVAIKSNFIRLQGPRLSFAGRALTGSSNDQSPCSST
jgi:hypothetical protein